MNINELLKAVNRKGNIWVFKISYNSFTDYLKISAFNSLHIKKGALDNTLECTSPPFTAEYRFVLHHSHAESSVHLSNSIFLHVSCIDNDLDLPFGRKKCSHMLANERLIFCNQKDIRKKLYLLPFLLMSFNDKESLYFYRQWLRRLESTILTIL